MKRLLKKTFKKYFASKQEAVPAGKGLPLWRLLFPRVLAGTALASSLALTETANATIIDWSDPATTAAINGLGNGVIETVIVGPYNGVYVRLTITDRNRLLNGTGGLNVGNDPTGGFGNTLTLITQNNLAAGSGTTRGTGITTDIEFVDASGNPIPVEQARLVVVDLDYDFVPPTTPSSGPGDNTSDNIPSHPDEPQWQDRIFVSGQRRDPGNVANFLDVNLSAFSFQNNPNFLTGGGPAFGLGGGILTDTVEFLTPTVSQTEIVAVGIIDQDLNNPSGDSTASVIGTPPGNDTLNTPGEAYNQSPEGNAVFDFVGTPGPNGQSVQRLRIFYDSADGLAGSAPNERVLTRAGNPQTNAGIHGIGLFNTFVVPPIIGVGKNVSGPIANPPGASAGAVTYTYTVRVENLGQTALNQVQLEENLTDTFGTASINPVAATPPFSVSNLRNAGSPGAVTLALNSAFNGQGNNNLLSGTDTLTGDDPTTVANEPGQFGVIQFDVTLEPNRIDRTTIPATNPLTGRPQPGAAANSTTFENNVRATGVSPRGTTVTDVSTDDVGRTVAQGGPRSDTQGRNPANPANPTNTPDGSPAENVSTPVTLAPRIGVSERVVSRIPNSTGPFGATTVDVVYEIAVRNLGAVNLENVQLLNDLEYTYGTGAFQVQSAEFVDATGTSLGNTVTGPGTNLTLRGVGAGNYTGADGTPATEDVTAAVNNQLLVGGSTSSLAIGDARRIRLRVAVNTATARVTPTASSPNANNLFLNQTRAEGTAAGTTTPTVDDLSNDVVVFAGTDSPSSTQVLDAIDPDTDGNPNELAGQAQDPANPPAGSENVKTPVSFDPAIGVTERVITAEPFPGGIFGADTFRVTYVIQVRNVGIENLQNVNLRNNFSNNLVIGGATFDPSGNFYELVSVEQIGQTVGGPSNRDNPVNGAYNGGDLVDNPGGVSGAANELLLENGNLNVGETSTYQIVVDVNGANGGANLVRPLPGPYYNSTLAEGNNAVGINVRDLSNDFGSVAPGQDPIDPNGDGDAGGTTAAVAGNPAPDPVPPAGSNAPGPIPANNFTAPSENTPTPVTLSTVFLVKRITAVFRGGVPLPIANIDAFNNQLNDGSDDLLFARSGNAGPLGVFEVPDTLQQGDVVQYTVYFFNVGANAASNALNLELCDELQVPSILNPGSLVFAAPAAFPNTTLFTSPTFGGAPFLSEQAPLSPLAGSCLSAPGTFPADPAIPGAGGGVVVGGPTSGLNLDNNQVGAFRFTIRVP